MPLWRNERSTGGAGLAYYSVWNKGQDADGLLHPSMSNDGITFTARTTYNTYTPHASSGLCGDPELLNAAGRIWVSMSPGVDFTFTNNTLEIASSTDGDTFTYNCSPDFTATMIGGSYNSIWNDPWFVDNDGSVHMFLERSQSTNHSQEDVWLVDVTLGDPCTFGTPVQITGTDFPSSYQNPWMTNIAGTYYLFLKDNTLNSGTYKLYTSTSRTSGFALIRTMTEWGAPKEAICIIPQGSERRAYLDADGTGEYYSNSSGGLDGTWTSPSAITCDFGTPQHGCVIANPTNH